MEPHIYGVTEVNQLVKGLLDSAPALQGVAVRGELSNYKIYPSGHHYFTLKDQEGALRCVMFRGQASRLRFRPENGMKAVASGRITVFPRDGAYQLYCDSLIPEGVGDLAAKRVMTDGMAYVQDKRLDLDHLQQRLGDVTGAVLGRHRQKFAALAASLDAMSPLAVLGRGYAVARDEQGKILKSWRETAPGSRVSVTLGEGGFTAVVDKPYTKEEQP